MADFTFNIAKGNVKYYCSLPAANDALVFCLFKASGLEADAALKDHVSLTDIVTGPSKEATFTNYSRKSFASGITITVDNTNDRTDFSGTGVITWAAAGGALNDTVAKMIMFYDPDTTVGTDADLVPVFAWDFNVITDGTDILANPSASGFGRAQ